MPDDTIENDSQNWFDFFFFGFSSTNWMVTQFTVCCCCCSSSCWAGENFEILMGINKNELFAFVVRFARLLTFCRHSHHSHADTIRCGAAKAIYLESVLLLSFCGLFSLIRCCCCWAIRPPTNSTRAHSGRILFLVRAVLWAHAQINLNHNCRAVFESQFILYVNGKHMMRYENVECLSPTVNSEPVSLLRAEIVQRIYQFIFFFFFSSVT